MRKRWWVLVLLLVLAGMLAFKTMGHDKQELAARSEAGKSTPENTAAKGAAPGLQEEVSEAEKERKKPSPRPEIKKRPKDEGPPVARSVPGKQGYVFSPISGNIVDVRDIPPGTLVQDPSADASEKAVFRIPPDENSAEGAEGK